MGEVAMEAFHNVAEKEGREKEQAVLKYLVKRWMYIIQFVSLLIEKI